MHFLNPILFWVAGRHDPKHEMGPVGAVDEEIQIGSPGEYVDATLGWFSPPVPEAAGLQRESPEVVHV
jgi:hypothetical protein